MKLYERAKNIVLSDEFGLSNSDFSQRLAQLVKEYFVYDGLTVETERGGNNNMLITVSVKRARPFVRPND